MANYYYVRTYGQLATGKYYVTYNNNLMPSAEYTFDEDGKMIIETEPEEPDQPEQPEEPEAKNGICDENGTLYYYVNGVKQMGLGLIEYEGDYYYVRTYGQLATGRYYVTYNNNLMPAAEYTFGADGKMIIETEPEQPDQPEQPEEKNGIYNENGTLYYYVNGVKQVGLGLIEYEGDYYYVRTSGQLATGRYYVTYNNNLMPAAEYTFGVDGKMIIETEPEQPDQPEQPEEKNGIYNENGTLYYYVNGVKQVGLGLIEYQGDYYYVRTSGQLATGRYYVTYNNNLMPSAMYTFDEDGKLVMETAPENPDQPDQPDQPEEKNGIYSENGTLYYYMNGVKQVGLGLIEYEGDYYYVRTSGQLATGRYYVTYNNNLMPSATYTFGENGKMIIENAE